MYNKLPEYTKTITNIYTKFTILTIRIHQGNSVAQL